MLGAPPGESAADVAIRRKKAAKPKTSKRSSAVSKAASAASPERQLAEYRRKRDFSRTAEPRGGAPRAKPKLAFVIQKHAASHLHYDLRLELDGVMKSWAVPKGPSLDPTIKRLAMQVEDHPIEYNTFEGTIPAGEYGGGTVMLWDRGTYGYGGSDPDPLEGLRRGYAKGDLKFVLNGKRLKGSWVLVRMRRDQPGKAQWLLIKHRDEYALEGSDVTGDVLTSVATGRTMEEIASGRSRVWRSNRPAELKGLALLRSLRGLGPSPGKRPSRS
jgi:bifunctional non-homologous end joining protein LigD